MNGKLPENSVVKVNGLKKGYKDKNAVDGVYFGIESDTLFCLLGPNGILTNFLFNSQVLEKQLPFTCLLDSMSLLLEMQLFLETQLLPILI